VTLQSKSLYHDARFQHKAHIAYFDVAMRFDETQTNLMPSLSQISWNATRSWIEYERARSSQTRRVLAGLISQPCKRFARREILRNSAMRMSAIVNENLP
jgi:hypothetical protein